MSKQNEWGNLRAKYSLIERVEKHVEEQKAQHPNQLQYQSVPNFVNYILDQALPKEGSS